MKIQELAIIFIIIILPISIILSVYTQFQIQTLNIQTLYDTKLTSATFDAIKAFQLNTANNTMSNLANSKIRDIEASIKTFKNSIASTFGLTGISEEEMEEYIPALVYTMYDGFYVYSPYTNKNDLGINNDGETIYGLKPYVTYSCEYKYTYDGHSNDIVITYSLDNYITIKGMIGGKYINDSGYLIDGIEDNKSTGVISYNGVTIDVEQNLKEFVAGIEYPYRKINGTKYYYDNNETIDNIYDDRIFYISNGEKVTQGDLEGEVALQYYHTVIKNNTSDIQYYKNALEFKARVLSYGLDKITYDSAYDTTTKNKIWANDSRQIFDFNDDKDTPEENIECELSNFNQHKIAVIKNVMQNNLSTVIANYNTYSEARGIDFQMPELTDEEWENVTKNISLISFVQGIPIGGKIYNGYTIVNNTESKEVVKEEDIYVIGKDNYYHKIGDTYIETKVNIGDNDEDIPAGRLKLDFKRASVLDEEKETVYYYPREEYASYDSVVTQNSNSIKTYDDIYAYVASTNDTLKDVFYTALGRERKSAYKATNHNSYVYDVLVALYYPATYNYESTAKNIINRLNEEDNIRADYIVSSDQTQLIEYMTAQKNNYQLMIVNSLAWSFPDLHLLKEAGDVTNLLTIGNDSNRLPMMADYMHVNNTSSVQEVTALGKRQLGVQSINNRSDSAEYVVKFNNDVKVLGTATYSGGVTGVYDTIGYWKNGEYNWVHAQIALGGSVADCNLIAKLAQIALRGIPEETKTVLLAAWTPEDPDGYYERYANSINEKLNSNSIIESSYIFSTDKEYIAKKIREQAKNYDLVIIDSFDNELPIDAVNDIRRNVSNKTNMVTISSKSTQDLDIINTVTEIEPKTVLPNTTFIGQHYLKGEGIANTTVSNEVSYIRGIKSLAQADGKDVIAYWETTDYRWIHSAINIEKGSETNGNSGETIITNLALMALKGQDSYRIIFDANEGTVSPQSIEGYYGDVISLPTATRTGHQFEGWQKSIGGVVSTYIAGEGYTITSTEVLTATWEPLEYTISFYHEGYFLNTMTVKYGRTVSLPAPATEKTGYSFSGWIVDGISDTPVTGIRYTIDRDTIAHTAWNPNQYTINYYESETAYNNKNVYRTQTVTYDNNVTLDLASLNRQNYIFNGWYCVNNGQTYTDSVGTYQIAEDMHLIAQLDPMEYTITYKANGGTGSDISEKYKYGQTITLKSDNIFRAPTGHEFYKWNTAANGSGTAYNAGISYTVTGDVIFHALWTPMTYTVTYKANGGKGSDISEQYQYGQKITLKSGSAFEAPTGHSFKNWNMAANGTGAAYEGGASYTVTGDATFHAQWQTNTVSYTMQIRDYVIYGDNGWEKFYINDFSGGNSLLTLSSDRTYFTATAACTVKFDMTVELGGHGRITIVTDGGNIVWSEIKNSEKFPSTCTVNLSAGQTIGFQGMVWEENTTHFNVNANITATPN